MSEVKVNKISPRTNCGTTQLGDAGDTITVTGDLKSNSIKTASGSTLTLGQSGDTVTLASGASQSGFGRTGTVDWDTTAKTASFTAVSGDGYFVNTSSGAITVTLPASPSAGDIVSIADYTNTFQANNCTIERNGSPLGGVAANATLSTEGQSVTFVYVDGTEGWKNVQDSTSNVVGTIPFMEATVSGACNTLTTCGDCKVATFVGPGTFCVSQVSNVDTTRNQVSFLVIGGGGGGGPYRGGGGGAGGFREFRGPNQSYSVSPLNGATPITVTASPFPITVGGGGAAANKGSDSIFSSITSAGGGAGQPGPQPGGSGGGGRTGAAAGSGNTPPVSPPQGANGGAGGPSPGPPHWGAGGGGGAIQPGDNGGPGGGGNGGNGTATSITGSSVTRLSLIHI